MRRALLVAAFGLVTLGCSWMSEPCPCGRSFERDPWDEGATLSVGPNHAIGVHCLCRCGGEGEAIREDPSATCERFETACTLPSGERSTYVCE
ncbi:MAG TPA: hypothetical protein RMH99_30230 [Sandaracinaceae bacterium LLY-WYZ-13_1]|nr:hypothetical protein [Sandaracinaceae bacterium LLY-WYZ-13_1]